MYHGIVESESLNNPVILNELKTLKVIIEPAPHSSNPYWHIYVLTIEDKEIEEVTKKLSLLIKSDWYAVFWSKDKVYVVLQNTVVPLKKENDWSSNEYKEMQRVAVSRGVQEEYLDFNLNFPEYEKIVAHI